MTKRMLFLVLIILLATACNSPKNTSKEPESPIGAEPPKQDGGASDPRSGLAPSDPAEEIPQVNDGDRIVIFYNGTVLTINDAQPTAEALAIQGDKILAVGSEDEIFTYQTENTHLVDLGGRTLMPGLVDGHSHLFTGYGNYGGSILAVQEQVLAEGITTMADMGGGRGEIIEELRALEESGELHMRVSMYLNQVTNCGEDFGYWYEDFPQSIEPGALVQIPGVKIFLDGGSCNKIARSVGDPGDLYFTLEEATQLVADIDARGYQAAVHALGDRAIEQILQVMDTVIGSGPNQMRHRIEHNASVRPDQIPLYSKSKPVAMIFGETSACWWSGSDSRFAGSPVAGTEEWEAPYRSLIESNPEVVFAWHEDAPIFNLGAIHHLWGMVTRKQINGDGTICDPPEWAADQGVPVETALKVMTINSAYALFRDDQIGSLELGKLADMIILSENPLTIPPEDLINLEVLTTLVNGRTVYCGGPGELCP